MKVSNQDLNRIAVPSRILKVYTSKSIEVKVEGTEAYIKVPQTVTGPIELYLLTEQETFTLMLVPVPIPAETVIIKAGVQIHPGLESEAYIREIKSLLRAVANGEAPPGYDVSLVENGKEECPVKECSLVAVRRYTGRRFIVEEYQLANSTKEPRTYREEFFAHAGTRAVAIERHQVDPGGGTRLLLVEEVAP